MWEALFDGPEESPYKGLNSRLRTGLLYNRVANVLCVCVCACARAYVCVRVRVRVRAYVCVRVRVRVCVSVSVSVSVCLLHILCGCCNSFYRWSVQSKNCHWVSSYLTIANMVSLILLLSLYNIVNFSK